MDQNDLFLSCRKGDLQRIKYLVEYKDVELNIRDKWDSTPLYYACLCGHAEVVDYLLRNGARCEANTFDGERCIYGALNTEIRSLLRDFKVVTSKILRRDNYEEFLRRLLEIGDFSDVTFVVHGVQFNVHRFILCARCDYFAEMFSSKWKNRRLIHINNPLVTQTAFSLILQFIYTGRIDLHVDQVPDCNLLAKQCRLNSLIHYIEESIKKAYSFACTKPGTKMTTLVIEPQEELITLQDDLAAVVQQSIPSIFCQWVGGSELPFLTDIERPLFTDLCVVVEGYHFYCHKCFVCSRSEYFRALVDDHFMESTMDQEANMISITLHDVTAVVFKHILFYIYCNNAGLLTATVYDVLSAADLYLLNDLKQQCAMFMASHFMDSANVVMLLKISKVFTLPRLENMCAEFIAKHLEKVLENEEFHSIILEDASDVKSRQQTDTIAIIDDIRYFITSDVKTFSAMEDANEKLQMIDKLLDQLGLDA